MIGWLKGKRIENWKQGTRQGVILACGGVGYEVQLSSRHLIQTDSLESFILWIHQVQHADGYCLFGFPERQERDLFRILIGVSGVGPQTALALLDKCLAQELTEAIIKGDLRKLSSAQGVGKRTAERIAVELRVKLAEFNYTDPGASLIDNESIQSIQLKSSSLLEIQSTLSSLGYEDLEIRRALRAISNGEGNGGIPGNTEIPPSPNDTDAWLKASLLWLSQLAA